MQGCVYWRETITIPSELFKKLTLEIIKACCQFIHVMWRRKNTVDIFKSQETTFKARKIQKYRHLMGT